MKFGQLILTMNIGKLPQRAVEQVNRAGVGVGWVGADKVEEQSAQRIILMASQPYYPMMVILGRHALYFIFILVCFVNLN